MIRVQREQVDENNTPIKPSDAWFKKAEHATAKAIEEGADHKVSYLYRDDEVRKALERLFQRKCAYCESRLGTVSPEEVDHYRPKGAVAEQPEHPGYYWLAYHWENLYPSCTSCNQRRRDRPHWGQTATRPPAGKGTSFPLQDEEGRAMTPEADLGQERPLLLDPCSLDIDPEERFRYDVQGQIHPVLPEDSCAWTTIRICHLDRSRLKSDRQVAILKIRKLVQALKGLRARLGSADQDVATLQQILTGETRANAPYAGVARYVVRDPGAFP